MYRSIYNITYQIYMYFLYSSIYLYIIVFKLHIVFKKNYIKLNVLRFKTILNSSNSLNNFIYMYIHTYIPIHISIYL